MHYTVENTPDFMIHLDMTQEQVNEVKRKTAVQAEWLSTDTDKKINFVKMLHEGEN